MWDLLRPGNEPVSPALAGRFYYWATTEAPSPYILRSILGTIDFSPLLIHGTRTKNILRGFILHTHTCIYIYKRWSNLTLISYRIYLEIEPMHDLKWKILWTVEPGRLQSMGSLRVGHNWTTSLSLFTFTHWRRKWQPTPVLLPGESQGRGTLVGFHLWGRTESDMTEAT